MFNIPVDYPALPEKNVLGISGVLCLGGAVAAPGELSSCRPFLPSLSSDFIAPASSQSPGGPISAGGRHGHVPNNLYVPTARGTWGNATPQPPLQGQREWPCHPEGVIWALAVSFYCLPAIQESAQGRGLPELWAVLQPTGTGPA